MQHHRMVVNEIEYSGEQFGSKLKPPWYCKSRDKEGECANIAYHKYRSHQSVPQTFIHSTLTDKLD